MSSTMEEEVEDRAAPKKPHTCRVCGRPVRRVSNGAGWRRTCSDECARVAGKPWLIPELLEQRREDDARGVHFWTPEEDDQPPRMAVRTCSCCNTRVPEWATPPTWSDGTGRVHILSD